MGLWRDHLLPRLVDKGLAGEEHARCRARAAAGLSGAVLELGFGSGHNLPHYPPAVRTLYAVDPVAARPGSIGRRLAERSGRLSAWHAAHGADSIRFLGPTAEVLDLPAGSVDAVLSTWTLCSVPDPARALSEVRRVLRPGGELRFVEHGRAPDADVLAKQQRWEPLQRFVFGGCRVTLPIDELLRGAGYELRSLSTGYLPGGPRFSSYLYAGVATPRS
ncbi:MAG: class I SAM-dependent methyltransferase [Planctomycetota bacterium]